MKIVLRIFAVLILVPVSILILLLLFGTILDYRPPEKENLFKSEQAEVLPQWTEYDVMIWNIGYCGLNSNMDFFYDGGKQVRPDEDAVLKSIDNVTRFLYNNDSVEFFLLQEVDINSRRSYHFNQYERISESLPVYHTFPGINYKVFFVPLPPKNPMGKVKSGLQTLSKFEPVEVERYSFPGNYSWPMGAFMLDRCFLVSRFKVEGGKELLVINTHNSAYDDGSLRAQQMDYLKDFILTEYENGNYILVGGDWNQSPYDFQKSF